MKPNLVRTEKHALKAGSEDLAAAVAAIAAYRKLVRALAGIALVHWPELTAAESRCFAFERLFHATADNPHPRYLTIDRMFPKFPSYLRRAAIEAACGAVSSYLSNYSNWLGGKRARRDAKPPQLGRFLDVNPPLYGGNLLMVSENFKSVYIKLLYPQGWRFSEAMPVFGRLRRLDDDHLLSPTLIKKGGKLLLACPVKLDYARWAGGDLVCAVDVGINTAATCVIVDSTGTVRARKFLRSGCHNDQLDKLAQQVRNRASKTVNLSKGFCATLYRRMSGLSQDAAQKMANAIVAFANEHEATSLVFENLKGWRPRAKRARLRQRFHRWLHRLLVKKATYKAEERGMKVSLEYPRGTSAWAHDGSGKVSRDSKNYSLCTFASGKRYNADLNAALNIAARYIVRMLAITPGNRPAAATGKSSRAASRMPIVLADLWEYAGAPRLASLETQASA